MTVHQILLRSNTPAQKAALAFAHSLNHGTRKVLNLVGSLPDGHGLAASLYTYMSGTAQDTRLLKDADLSSLSRKDYTARCLILVAGAEVLSSPAHLTALSHLLRHRHDHNKKTLVVSEQALTQFHLLRSLSPVCHTVPL